MNTQPIVRPAARILLIDADDRILLFRGETASRSWWFTPGGGLAEGETYESAARRELLEETGITEFELGPCVWTRDHTYDFEGVTYRQIERFFVVRVPNTEIDTTGMEDNELGFIKDHKWWSVAQIHASDEEFSPRQLAVQLEDLLSDRTPSQPFDVGL